MKQGARLDLVSRPTLIAAAGKYHGLRSRRHPILGSCAPAKFARRRFEYARPARRRLNAGDSDSWEFSIPGAPPGLFRLIAPAFPYQNHTLDSCLAQAREKRLGQIKMLHAPHLPDGCSTWESELREQTPTHAATNDVVTATLAASSERSPYVSVVIRANLISHELTLKSFHSEGQRGRMREIRQLWPDATFYTSPAIPKAPRLALASIRECYSRADKWRYRSRAAIIASTGALYMLAGFVHLRESVLPKASGTCAAPGQARSSSGNFQDIN